MPLEEVKDFNGKNNIRKNTPLNINNNFVLYFVYFNIK